MSLLIYGAAFVVGLVLGPFVEATLFAALPGSWGSAVGRMNIETGLRNGHAWTLHEAEGSAYEIQHLSPSDDLAGKVLINGDDDVFEDVGLMGHIEAGGERVPFGCTFEGHRVISSPLVATIGAAYGELQTDAPAVDERLMTDGGTAATGGDTADADGPVDPLDEQRSVNWYRKNALLARAYSGGHVVEVVNGAAEIPAAAIADVKETVRLLSHAGDPEQPKRAAENAENAERARVGSEGLFGQLKGGIYYVMGLLTAYIFLEVLAGGGGGGGGGGVDTGITGIVNIVGALGGVV